MTTTSDPRPIHPAGADTAAQSVTDAIRRRIPDWPNRLEGLCWLADDPDHENQRAVVVATGQLSQPWIAPRRGPLIVGLARDVEVRISLPTLVDGADIDNVLAALTALDVLPPA